MEIDMSKKWFWMLLNVVLIVMVLNVVFFVMPMLSNLGRSFTPTHVITVSGNGKTTAIPDIATVSFSVVAQGANPNDLAKQNNDKMNTVIKFVEGKGVAEKDIETTGYNLNPNYSYDRATGKSTIYGYTLTQTVTVKIRDFGTIGDVIAGMTPLGVNEINGPSFTFDDQEKFIAIARADAIEKARAKALDMAHAAGTTLGEVVTVSESGNYPYPIYYAKDAMLGMGGAPSATPPSPTIQPGSQDITDTVTITYALR